MDITNIITLVKFHEGFRLVPYQCTEGRWTWGYGRNIQDNPPHVNELLCMLNDGVTEHTAAYWLSEDLRRTIEHMFAHMAVEWSVCNAPRRAVLVDMGYNLGVSGLLKFYQTRQHIRNRDFAAAAIQMGRSKWATQVKTRATRLCKMMRTGEWPDDVPGIIE